jgi:PIN domain nuclease of toxin-antitoxin system
MRILIDTHILIWHLEDDQRLSSYHGYLIEDPANSVFVSIASFWEIAIKLSLGKLSLSRPLDDVIRATRNSTSIILPIEPEHTLQVARLPHLHKDPFDRMLVAQALMENISLISTDQILSDYGAKIL